MTDGDEGMRPMDEREWLAERFEPHRAFRRAAHRILGSLSEADDDLAPSVPTTSGRYLEEHQHRVLREIARRRRVSVGRLLRDGADRVMHEAPAP